MSRESNAVFVKMYEYIESSSRSFNGWSEKRSSMLQKQCIFWHMRPYSLFYGMARNYIPILLKVVGVSSWQNFTHML